jgi:ABC-type transport system involved in multi-copper enzyme maturation permease subunit
MLLFTLAFALAVVGCVYYISVLFPQASYDGILPALGMSWVQGMFFASFAVFASTVAKTPTSGAILGFAGYAVLSIRQPFRRWASSLPRG